MWPASKRQFQQEAFRQYIETLSWPRWRPSMIVLHNTAAPSLAQWHETSDQDRQAGRIPGTTRINSLERYFRDEKKWSGCPHLFIPDDRIWEMNPLTAPGVHSPSWNTVSIGIEMVADFDREDDDAGTGLLVRRNAVFATAVLCSTLGLDPTRAVKLHREDPQTTHACPGKDFADDRTDVIGEILALMDGGDHEHHDTAVAIGVAKAPPVLERRGVALVNDLNVRSGPGVVNPSIGSLRKGAGIAVLGEAPNGTTSWLNIRTPAGISGWVAGKYVKVG